MGVISVPPSRPYELVLAATLARTRKPTAETADDQSSASWRMQSPGQPWNTPSPMATPSDSEIQASREQPRKAKSPMDTDAGIVIAVTLEQPSKARASSPRDDAGCHVTHTCPRPPVFGRVLGWALRPVAAASGG